MIDYNKQEGIVLEYFDEAQFATPSEVWKYTADVLVNVPLTSIRRAITNLTDKGHLIKLQEKSVGIYGRLEHIWERV